MVHERDIRIIAVDDDIVSLKMAEALLEDLGFTVDSFESGTEAIVSFETNQYDLVLMDINLPKMSGHDVIVKFREKTPEIPVIMMTVESSESSIQDVFKSGANDYITKPFRSVELNARISNVLKTFHAERKYQNLYREMSDDLLAAAQAQKYLLPSWCGEENNIIYSSYYSPSNIVSGDLFDVIKLDESKTLLCLGDISGHGVKSGVLMTSVVSAIRALVSNVDGPLTIEEIYSRLNHPPLSGMFKSNYMTIVLGILDHEKNCFQYFNAGHPPLVKVDLWNRTASLLNDSGHVPLGWDLESNDDFVYNQIEIDNNHIYMMLSDGIFECSDKYGSLLGLEGFLKFVNECLVQGTDVSLPQTIISLLKENGYALESDDVTAISFSRKDSSHNREIFTGKLEDVQRITELFHCYAFEATKNKLCADRVELALTEILNNIVIHGAFPSTAGVNALIEYNHSNDFKLNIYEQGDAWDRQAKTNTLVSDYSTSGRGLKMLQELCITYDVSHYEGINHHSAVFSAKEKK